MVPLAAIYTGRYPIPSPTLAGLYRGICMTMFCYEFYLFKDAISVLPPAADDFRPPVALLQLTEAAAVYYDSETKRSEHLTPPLAALLNRVFTTRNIRSENFGLSGSSPDKVLESTVSIHGQKFRILLSVREDKNELGSTGNDPTRQCAIAYEKIILHVSPVLIYLSLSVADTTAGIIQWH